MTTKQEIITIEDDDEVIEIEDDDGGGGEGEEEVSGVVSHAVEFNALRPHSILTLPPALNSR